MGRPPVINETNYDTPLPEIDTDEPWQPHPSDPVSVDFTPIPGHVMAAFREASVQLVILGEILDRIYPVRPVTQSVKRQALTELEAKLDRWYAELPDFLTFDAASARFIPSPNVLLLHIKYWNIVLLLHRAFIPKWRPDGHTRSSYSQDTMALKSFDICQSAATHMTNIIVAYQNAYTLKHATMIIVQHLFAAGIMHVVTLTMRPSNVQTSVALQRVLAALKELSVRWPAAQRAWELVSGAHTHVDNGFPQHAVGLRHHKRGADDAFGLSEKVSDVLQQEAFEDRSRTQPKADSVTSPAPGASATTNRVLAHMLGLDIPGIEPSTSYLPGYQWWPRNSANTSTPTPTQANPAQPTVPPPQRLTQTPIGNGGPVAASSDTPSPHSSTGSPPSAMPIPFSFDVSQSFWNNALPHPGVAVPPSSEYTLPGSFNHPRA